MAKDLGYQVAWVRSLVKEEEKYNHCLRVASICRTALEPLGFVHDLVEDGYASLDDVASRFGFTEAESAALDALTRKKGEPYAAYIKRVAENPLAREVKLCDLEDNICRCASDVKHYHSLLLRYAKAYEKLTKRNKERR